MNIDTYAEDWDRALSSAESAQFMAQLEQDGIVGPFRVCGADEACRLADKFLVAGSELDARVAATADPAERKAAMRAAFLATRNRHLYDADVRSLLERPSLVSRLAASLGEHLVVWRTQAFVQHARRMESGVAPLQWHRDNYLTLLDLPRTNVSVHLALSHSVAANCMRALIGSHRMSDEDLARDYGLRHVEGSEQSGPGTSRYDGDVAPGSVGVRHLVMAPGEAYLFTDRLVHASSWTDDPNLISVRVALALRVTVPSVRVLPPAFRESLPREDLPLALDAATIGSGCP